MNDKITNATEAASECQHCRCMSHSIRVLLDELSVDLLGITRRVHNERQRHNGIPPQGEQAADDGMMRVDRETLAEMHEYFTMRTDEDAIVFGATLKLILGDHHKKGGA